MKFGPVPVAEAQGAINAHTVKLSDGVIKKGTVLTGELVERLRASGIDTVITARLDPDDMGENGAAEMLAQALTTNNLTSEPAFTGRANLFAEAAGLLAVDSEAINRLNGIDPAITVATLPNLSAVEPGRMAATIKIIPFAVARRSVEAAAQVIAGTPVLTLHPFRPMKVGVISTRLESLKERTIDKTLDVLRARLEAAGGQVVADLRVAHETDAIAEALDDLQEAGVDLKIVFGASAIADRYDVIPSAIEAAGGSVDHFGMPVDPGNLLLIGRHGSQPVIGAPGCARSPQENGFDFVLRRLLAGLEVGGPDIVSMGVGGLLKEIVTRRQPRDRPVSDAAERPVSAVILAAGRSTRMGGPNKLLAELDGEPLIRRAARAALGSRARETIVVVGHMAGDVRAALAGLDVTFVDNPDFADGLSTSLQAGVGAVSPESRAAVFLLGDMPRIDAAIVDSLIDRFDPTADSLIVVPTSAGKRGNPVLLSRRFFAELENLTGDVGARHLIGLHGEAVTEVELGADVALDVDTPEAMRRAGGKLVGTS